MSPTCFLKSHQELPCEKPSIRPQHRHRPYNYREASRSSKNQSDIVSEEKKRAGREDCGTQSRIHVFASRALQKVVISFPSRAIVIPPVRAGALKRRVDRPRQPVNHRVHPSLRSDSEKKKKTQNKPPVSVSHPRETHRLTK